MEDESIFEPRVVDPRARKRRLWLIIIVAVVFAIFLFGSQTIGIYVDALWFSSLGYASVYWYKFKLGAALFLIFLVLTFVILKVAFTLLGRGFPQLKEKPRIKLSTVEDVREINLLPYIFRPGVWIVSVAVAFMFAVSMTQSWSDFALYLHASPSGVFDPVFHRDVSFFLFTVPVLELISGWFTTLAVILVLGVGGVAGYLWYFDKLRGFGTLEMGKRSLSAISLTLAFFALALAFNTYLSRFDLIVAPHDLFSGITYADDHAQLPGLTALIIALLAVALVLVGNAAAIKRGRIIIWCAVAVALVWLVGTVIIPQSVYSFSVKPNELAKESEFIDHNIQMTRAAYGLDKFEERGFTASSAPSVADLDKNDPTISNIRLWDPAVLQQTLGQIQEIRQYYSFGIPDIDRYTVNGQIREVMLAAREMNVDKLSAESNNWINQHLVYTHGYGVTMSTVNEFSSEGMPHLILKDMPVASDAPEVKVTRPEIYFGEDTNAHVYVHTKPQGKTAPEFNYPAAGSGDSYTEYQGNAGIQVGGLIRKILLSLYLGDGTNLIFSDYITSDSKLLIRRKVLDRVQSIAPFLMFDNDPYLVIDDSGRLFWMIDAFTFSARYPYSTSYPMGADGVQLNYIRNSVKVVVDAYQGSVNFYTFDDKDPIIKDYQSIFPVLFHPASEMPADLRRHIRYPNPLLQVQAQAYKLYHMTNPQLFYNHEDLWAIATGEPVAGAQPTAPPPMRPYYILMELPGESTKHVEFVNILPFTPAGADRTNMIGWLAGRSDGDAYGDALVFSFPKNVTINGPAQVRARVNQDPTLSGLMTLWSQSGSNLLRGNLLVIPIDDSLLYVEPFFLRAQNSPLPELKQVAVAVEDKLATAPTFAEAMQKLFPGVNLPPSLQEGAPSVAAAPPPGQQGLQNFIPQQGQPAQKPNQNQQAPPATPAPAPTGDTAQLAQQARQLLDEYGRLTAEGKYKEAGDKLAQLKQTLDELSKKGGSK